MRAEVLFYNGTAIDLITADLHDAEIFTQLLVNRSKTQAALVFWEDGRAIVHNHLFTPVRDITGILTAAPKPAKKARQRILD